MLLQNYFKEHLWAEIETFDQNKLQMKKKNRIKFNFRENYWKKNANEFLATFYCKFSFYKRKLLSEFCCLAHWAIAQIRFVIPNLELIPIFMDTISLISKFVFFPPSPPPENYFTLQKNDNFLRENKSFP